MKKSSWLKAVGPCLAAIVFTAVVHAQVVTGRIFGVVTDSTGAAVPDASVTLTSPALARPLVVTTGSNGAYEVPGIPIGIYTVSIDRAGFREFSQENISITIGFNAQINATLPPASAATTVTVTAAAPVVDVQSTAVSTELDAQTLTDLPLARSFFNELELSSGATESGKDVGGAQNLNQPSFVALGAPSGQNRFYYGGVDIAPAGGSNAMWTSFSSVQEMQVTQGGVDASVMTPGVSSNMVIKSGSAHIHGSFFDNEEGQTFESNNFSAAMRADLAPLTASPGNTLTHFRDIGGDIGGPFRTNGKVWYYGDFEEPADWVAAPHIYQNTPGCAPVAANPLNYSQKSVLSCEFSFPTYTTAYAGKISWTPFHNNTFNFLNQYSNKETLYNGLTVLVPLSATRPQNAACGRFFHWGGLPDQASMFPGAPHGLFIWNCGWPALFKWDDQQIINNNWVVHGFFTHYAKRNQFALNPPGYSPTNEYDTAPQEELTTTAIQDSNQAVVEFQPMNSVELDSSYLLPGKWLGGSHTFKAGYQWSRYDNWETENWGGNAEAEEIYNSGTAAPFSVPFAVKFYRYGYINQFLYQNSAYGEDTYSRGRWVFNLGVRFDRQTDLERGFDVPASPYEGQLDANGIPFTWLPSIDYPGAKDGVAWNTFAPRLGVAYNVRGKNTTVLKASFAQYFQQRTAGQLADTYNTTTQNGTQSYIEFPWNGAMANNHPLISGVNTKDIIGFGANYNPANPSNLTSPNSVDPNIKDPKTNEFTVGVNQQVAQGFGVDVFFTYRRYTDFIFDHINGISAANYVPCMTSPTAATPCSVTNPNTGVTTTTTIAATKCPTTAAPEIPTECPAVTYYVPDIPLPSAYTVENEPDYHQTYKGLQIIARKVLLRNWMFNGSLTFQSDRAFYTSTDAYQDPTNIAQQNGAQVAPTSSPGGGFPVSIAVNVRWDAKLSGLYKLPWGVAVSGVDDLSQGNPYLSTISVSTRPNSAGSIPVYTNSFGTQRLAHVQNLALRFDKYVTIHERWKLDPSFAIFNVLNSDPILGMQPGQNSASANQPEYELSPRILRLSLMFTF